MAQPKKFSRKEIAERNSKTDAVFVIDNQVYDVTKFLDDHPGGHEVLLNVAGKDATEDFIDIGHSLDAKDLMKKYVVGEVIDEDKIVSDKKSSSWSTDDNAAADESFINSWKFPVVLGLLATVLYSYLFG